jgi:hypothetical protein
MKLPEDRAATSTKPLAEMSEEARRERDEEEAMEAWKSYL